MKAIRIVVFFLAGGIFFTGCSSLAEIGTAVGVATGRIDESQAESLKTTAEAVSQSFEDITPEQEYYIGRAVGANILNQYDPWSNQQASDYLNLLGQALALVSDRPETFGGYHFLILDSEEINAFAAPGGLIFITKGMLRCTTDEATLAAVLAHEIGHVESKHGLQAIKKSRITKALTSVALTTVQLAGSDELKQLTGVFDESITDITSTLIVNGYSRKFESQADEAAVTILTRVGYDPNALIAMLEVMDSRLTAGGLDFAKTHPDPDDRISEVKKMISGSSVQTDPSQTRDNRYQAGLAGL